MHSPSRYDPVGSEVPEGGETLADRLDLLGGEGLDVRIGRSRRGSLGASLAMRDEIAQDVDGELRDGVEAGTLDDLLQLFVEGTRDLERDVSVAALAHPAKPPMAMVTIGTKKRPAVNAASRTLLLTILRWNLQIPLRTAG